MEPVALKCWRAALSRRAQVGVQPQQFLRLQQHLLPHLVQTGRAAYAVEQGEPQFTFQALHLCADGSLGQAYPVARRGEVPSRATAMKVFSSFNINKFYLCIWKKYIDFVFYQGFLRWLQSQACAGARSDAGHRGPTPGLACRLFPTLDSTP
jgi:hypothetical protein